MSSNMKYLDIRITEVIAIFSILIVQITSYSVEKANSSIDIFQPEGTHIMSFEDKVTTCAISICSATDNDDIVIGSSLSETIYGLNGNDNIQGNGGDDIIYGSLGDDTVQGGSGLDKLFGQDGNDYLYADSSTSTVSALTENKSLSTDDVFVDAVSSSNVESVELMKNISFGDGFEGVDIFTTLSPDILLLQQSFLDGGTGDDHLYGGSGDDIFMGGPGHDLFDCGEGVDQVLDFNSEEDTISTNCDII
jgi:Ca2+-binding RTX toxin-like protein